CDRSLSTLRWNTNQKLEPFKAAMFNESTFLMTTVFPTKSELRGFDRWRDEPFSQEIIVFAHGRSMTSCGHVATKSHFAIIRAAGLASLIPSTEGHNSPEEWWPRPRGH